jgi:SAM-dependent methyltransferase
MADTRTVRFERLLSMTKVDLLLQRWRIAKAKSFIPQGARVLDIGSHDGALFRALGDRLGYGVGVDPSVERSGSFGKYELIAGLFPQDVPTGEFDVITLLAVLEHIPEDALENFRDAFISYLRPGGRLIATVPSPAVDRILHVLERLRLIHGMALHEHHGFDARRTPDRFAGTALRLEHHERFELGVNNLFVFRRS